MAQDSTHVRYTKGLTAVFDSRMSAAWPDPGSAVWRVASQAGRHGAIRSRTGQSPVTGAGEQPTPLVFSTASAAGLDHAPQLRRERRGTRMPAAAIEPAAPKQNLQSNRFVPADGRAPQCRTTNASWITLRGAFR
jgi:hypothetical protein